MRIEYASEKYRRSRDEWFRLFLIYQQWEMSPISRLNDIVNILIKAGEGYLISNN